MPEFEEHLLGPGDNYARLTVSPGLWLAFKGLGEDNLVLNIADIRHNPIEADNRDLEDISYDW